MWCDDIGPDFNFNFLLLSFHPSKNINRNREKRQRHTKTIKTSHLILDNGSFIQNSFFLSNQNPQTEVTNCCALMDPSPPVKGGKSQAGDRVPWYLLRATKAVRLNTSNLAKGTFQVHTFIIYCFLNQIFPKSFESKKGNLKITRSFLGTPFKKICQTSL